MIPASSGALRFAPPVVHVDHRPDGSLLLRSPQPLGAHVRAVGDWLVRWASDAPQRTFLAERRNGEWFHLSYGEALRLARRIGQGLLDRGLGADTPVMVLSDNSIEHALLAFGAMHVGVPVVPVSTAYSLAGRDYAKLRTVVDFIRPGLVFAAQPERFAAALASIGEEAPSFESLVAVPATGAVDEAFAGLTPDTVAKILLTSGSTGAPKGVINTHRMLTVNQQQSTQVWPLLADAPPVLVDWLPWNHTFGGNYNLHLVLCHGGTLYIDGGKPVPDLIGTTLRNLREVAPTIYFNVPRGFDLLLPSLESDAGLRRQFFSRCAMVLYAGAALPANLWERLMRLARGERGEDFALISSWGATETAPLCTAVHFPIERADIVGLPVPGCELKLLPGGGKLEVRVRGPNVMPGYFRRDDLTRAAFDEEGFYRIGDALRFVDPSIPEKGLVFDGRVAEDFKLRTGTWVHVGALRVQLLAAADPLLQDAVITGHDSDEVGALLFLHPTVTAGLPFAEIRTRLSKALTCLNQEGGGSSMRVTRALVLAEPPRLDLGEITDKGYLNQRAVLNHRAAEVERLHAGAPDVILPA